MQDKTAQETLTVLEQFLSQVRAEKTAETVSFKDKSEATPAEQSKGEPSEGKDKQTNLGKEQAQEAKKSNSTVGVVSANSDAKDAKPTDDQGTKRLDADQPVATQGNIGHIVEQEITQEQKMARATRLGNAILAKLAAEMTPPPPVQKTAADEFLDSCLQKSAVYAQMAHDSYLYGMLKRAQDEAQLAEADFTKLGIDAATLQKIGGTSGLLDKIAMEDPMAVMPEGVVPEELMAPEGVVPEELMAPEGAAPEGEMSEADLEALAQALAEAGVEPEAIDEAAEAVAQLVEAKVSPEDAAAAIQQIIEEGLGEEPAIEPAAEPAPPVEEPKEAKERIDKIASFLRKQMMK
jgi:hypothetical protein